MRWKAGVREDRRAMRSGYSRFLFQQHVPLMRSIGPQGSVGKLQSALGMPYLIINARLALLGLSDRL